MDINKGRIILTQMQSCFVESSLQILIESEDLSQKLRSPNLSFSSNITRNDSLAQIQARLWLNFGAIQLSMFFEEELPHGTIPELLALMNDMNLSSAGSYWIAIPGHHKIEFRTAYILPGALNEEHFKGVLRRFLDRGLQQYDYLKKILNPGVPMN
jgi:hypothetical protein